MKSLCNKVPNKGGGVFFWSLTRLVSSWKSTNPLSGSFKYRSFRGWKFIIGYGGKTKTQFMCTELRLETFQVVGASETPDWPGGFFHHICFSKVAKRRILKVYNSGPTSWVEGLFVTKSIDSRENCNTVNEPKSHWGENQKMRDWFVPVKHKEICPVPNPKPLLKQKKRFLKKSKW